jgi:proline iminopeptidase
MTGLRIAPLLAASLAAGCADGDMFFVRSAGADMPVWVRGNTASNRIVLFVHGGPGGSGLVRAVNPPMRRIEGDSAVAYWDQRAAGNSQGDAQPETLTAERYADDLDLVVRVLAARYPRARTFLLGESWGGALTGFYLGDPERQKRIAGWIDVDGTPDEPRIPVASRSWALAEATARVQRGDDAARWSPVVDWYLAHPVLALGDLQQHGGYVNQLGGAIRYPERGDALNTPDLFLLSPFDVMSYLSNGGYTTDQFVLTRDASRSILFRDLSGDLGKVTVPTLALWGRHDGMVPLELGQSLVDRIATSPADKSLVILEDAAHVGIIDAPGPFADAVIAFLHAH